MIVDLVQVMTRDGVRLDGTYQSASQPRQLGVEGCLLVHGTGGNFYSSTLFDAIAERLLELGVSVLRVNTRGHDLMSTATTAQGGRRIGAAYEVVDDCRHDLAAWIDWLKASGHSRIGLIGHSLGAVKSAYALAHEPQAGIVGFVAVSPPRLSYSQFCGSAAAAEFLDTVRSAEQHVEAGRPNALLEVRIPLPFVVTAAGYLEKYGPDERYNFLNFIGHVPCPTLVTFGGVELENNIAFRDLPAQLASIAGQRRIQVEVVPNADHFYSSRRAELTAVIEQWMREQVGFASE